MSHTFNVAHSDTLHNAFRDWKMNLYFPRPTLHHLASFVAAMLSPTFQGTLADVARESFSPRDRRSLSHFLAWNVGYIQQTDVVTVGALRTELTGIKAHLMSLMKVWWCFAGKRMNRWMGPAATAISLNM